jgi:hypothetical protein
MRSMRFLNAAFWLATSALLVSACSDAGTPPSTSAVASREPAGSWMAPEAASQDLLYVSDSNGTIDVFSYPSGRRVGAIKGLASPTGLCSDDSGNVFVPETNNLDVLEFPHGATKSVKTLHDFGHYPFGCSVDPRTQDVAVANYSTTSQKQSNVAIFRAGHNLPNFYQDPAVNSFFFCGFDDKSNLYVDGADVGSYHTLFAELPAGSTTFTNITLDKTIGYPGGVQWDGKYVAVQDSYNRAVYRFKITGANGKSMKTVHFTNDRSTLIAQFWIAGTKIILPYGTNKRAVRSVGYWAYPAGGSASQSFKVHPVTELIGVTLSRAKK